MYYPNNDLKTLTKDIANKVEVYQRKIERNMPGLKQIDRIPNSTIRKRTKVYDIIKVITKAKLEMGSICGTHERQQVDSKMY